jgi:hypothetical protein
MKDRLYYSEMARDELNEMQRRLGHVETYLVQAETKDNLPVGAQRLALVRVALRLDRIQRELAAIMAVGAKIDKTYP